MFSDLADKIRNHAKNQSTDFMKRYYRDIADALDDEEFLQTLLNTETLNRLGYLRDNFEYSISSQNNYNDALNLVHAGYTAYRADKKRNIGRFSQKLGSSKTSFKKAKREYLKSTELQAFCLVLKS